MSKLAAEAEYVQKTIRLLKWLKVIIWDDQKEIEMKRTRLLLCMFIFPMLIFAQAGDERLTELREQSSKGDTSGWTMGGGIGLDFAQLFQFQPRIGAGQNRIAFGGLGTVFAKYKRDRWIWDNSASLQLAMQKLGDDIFTKQLDVLRFNSKAGYQLDASKWYVAVDGFLQTQLAKTYTNNLLSEPEGGADLLSQFFSPATFTLSAGLDYHPSKHLSLYYSPVALKMIIVSNDSIASLGVHGNPWNSPTDFENVESQIGSTFKASYDNSYYENRLSVSSQLTLYSNYLENFGNIDLLWTNDFGWEIVQNLSVNVLVELFYDDDIDLQRDTNDDGVYDPETDRFGPGLSITESLVLKYSVVF